MADVAQLVEPLVVVQVVAGSIPVVRPILFRPDTAGYIATGLIEVDPRYF